MEYSEKPLPTSRRDDKRYGASKSVADSTKAKAETALSDARKTVRDLALKIEESNSRAKSMQQKQQKTSKWHGQEEHELSLKNKEDYQYAQVVKEIERIKHELGQLKLDMKRVLKGKKQAESAFKASGSKNSTLSSAVERIKKEIEDIDEEHVLVELARIEAVKEREAIEAQRKEEANRYQTQLEEVKRKVKDVDQHDEVTQELQLTLYNVNILEKELALAKETNVSPDLLHTITEELETAKTELANIKREGFNFITSIDVLRNELKLVQEDTARLEKEEEKRDATVQALNTKILKGKAKLESVTATTENANLIASNLSLTVDQLRAETETAKKEKELIIEEIEKIKLEIPKTESEIELSEKRLEAAMEELKTAKSSEFTALENLKNLIESTVQSRELTSQSNSTIKITNFEYEYLTGKAGGAEEIADKKVAAAQAWVEALKANEKEIMMKTKMAKQEIKELNVEVDDDGGDAYGTDTVGRRRTVDGELNTWGQNEVKVVASPRRSMYKVGNMTPGKRRSQKFLSPAARQAIKSASFTRKREKTPQNLEKLLDENDVMGE
ncbi:putative WEB family protein [Helianthus annuus]|uniref:WEB family protein n=1 Tax=Helianthus annuus TaxID=4232 RepID=A0A9K3I6K9_HELAN|nr:protein PLASTID MOVEMENT IMPAIRED 2 isoform X1 [Helianthus annuus]XP_021983089.1 protein PLASTID MOVEMENT IMPAIRED 2 isoform X1 [Helianthus annuus]XP_035833533.1 protein PLASTID MOVEMENT IMPAIRED 2 isoform X1 [Helianthus annuus]KAF5791433.1 putative WEB family protein [Helianthus annuus]KAJ0534944.1 putative WEB family protein [Helianthus annuus]KAJ0888843.1 putative WEB family protein [Helianthus annuus]KAJ0893682.1 putative WEB family protein [Helianthus annuus]